MPVYRAMLEKYHSFTNEYWTNRYFIQAASLADAVIALNGVRDAERGLYTSFITVTKGHVDDNIPNTPNYETPVYNMAGTRPAPSGQMMPLFVTARVDFSVQGGGRPSRKYLRGVLWESDADITSIEAGMVTILNTYGANVVAAGVCDPQGQDVVSSAAFMSPQMRQLRRGSKKKSPHNRMAVVP